MLHETDKLLGKMAHQLLYKKDRKALLPHLEMRDHHQQSTGFGSISAFRQWVETTAPDLLPRCDAALQNRRSTDFITRLLKLQLEHYFPSIDAESALNKTSSLYSQGWINQQKIIDATIRSWQGFAEPDQPLSCEAIHRWLSNILAEDKTILSPPRLKELEQATQSLATHLNQRPEAVIERLIADGTPIHAVHSPEGWPIEKRASRAEKDWGYRLRLLVVGGTYLPEEGIYIARTDYNVEQIESGLERMFPLATTRIFLALMPQREREKLINSISRDLWHNATQEELTHAMQIGQNLEDFYSMVEGFADEFLIEARRLRRSSSSKAKTDIEKLEKDFLTYQGLYDKAISSATLTEKRVLLLRDAEVLAKFHDLLVSSTPERRKNIRLLLPETTARHDAFMDELLAAYRPKEPHQPTTLRDLLLAEKLSNNLVL